ncbi:MAG: response regulator transcription factor [Paracoccus sp. (in: a-proteobacteria)]
MRILLADDHDLIRETLAIFLTGQGLGPVTQAGSAHEAEQILHDVGGCPFDIILLDYDMPGMDGLEGFTRISRLAGDCPVAILSGIASPLNAQAAMAAGARGFLPKTLMAQELGAALCMICKGGIFLPPGFLDGPDGDQLPSLTTREVEVLRGLCSGKSNKELARELGLQEVTIKLHVRTLCRKLEARNRTHAAMIARDRRLLG